MLFIVLTRALVSSPDFNRSNEGVQLQSLPYSWWPMDRDYLDLLSNGRDSQIPSIEIGVECRGHWWSENSQGLALSCKGKSITIVVSLHCRSSGSRLRNSQLSTGGLVCSEERWLSPRYPMWSKDHFWIWWWQPTRHGRYLPSAEDCSTRSSAMGRISSAEITICQHLWFVRSSAHVAARISRWRTEKCLGRWLALGATKPWRADAGIHSTISRWSRSWCRCSGNCLRYRSVCHIGSFSLLVSFNSSSVHRSSSVWSHSTTNRSSTIHILSVQHTKHRHVLWSLLGPLSASDHNISCLRYLARLLGSTSSLGHRWSVDVWYGHCPTDSQ